MIDSEYASAATDEQPRALDRLRVAVPSLNIFLGSTPAYSALEVMRMMVNAPEVDQRHVALVFIDIDSPPPDLAQFRKEHPGVLREFALRIGVAKGQRYAETLDERIVDHTYIPAHQAESFDNGAGGIRNNGHVAACSDLENIERTLTSALAAISEIQPVQNAQPVTDLVINLVAFLGGGTGSGIVPDIAVMARHVALRRNLNHRLNIFCLLPEDIREVTTHHASWRKSNATATLLELVALSLVREAPGYNGRYFKYMMSTPFEVLGDTIANEVYLFGKTDMNSALQSARIIGMDLCSRIANASGAGALELSKAVDRKTLSNRDRNGLPTMFSTTCPLEVVFPAVETATAFAQLTAARVLPKLVGQLGEAGALQLTPAEDGKVRQWASFPTPPKPELFKDRAFEAAGRGRLDTYEMRIRETVQKAKENIADQVLEREREELRHIKSISQQFLAEQITQLQSLQRIYSESLKRARDQSIRRAELDPALQRKLLNAWPVLGMKDRAVAEVTDDYNGVLQRRISNEALTARRKLLERLLKVIDDDLERITHTRRQLDSKEVADRLIIAAINTAAWRGELEDQHVHRRHIFQLDELRAANPEAQLDTVNAQNGSASSPVQQLYHYLTRKTMEDYASEFNAWMRAKYPGGDAEAQRERLVQYLRDEVYLPALYKMNLLDLVRTCCVRESDRPDQRVEDIIYMHLRHIGALARDLIAFEDQLWTSGGTKNLDTSLYLGVNWKPGQKDIITRAKDRVDRIAKEGSSPQQWISYDPHCMQLVYGQHAISLGTIREFYEEDNSSMAEYLRHQRAWFGDGYNTYGKTNAPVFSSGEMERLAWDGNALGDPQGRPLHERVIRRHHGGAGQHPRWVRPGGGNGGNPPYGGGGQGYLNQGYPHANGGSPQSGYADPRDQQYPPYGGGSHLPS